MCYDAFLLCICLNPIIACCYILLKSQHIAMGYYGACMGYAYSPVIVLVILHTEKETRATTYYIMNCDRSVKPDRREVVSQVYLFIGQTKLLAD